MSDIYRPVATIMYQLGLRVSEALGLTWADIDFEGGELHVRQQLAPDGTLVPLKTARARRTLPLTADVRRELLAIRNRAAKRTLVKFDRAGRLFPNGERNNCRRAVARAADAARLNSGDGKPVGCHDLRHSFAFHCLVTLGLPVTQVSAYMGHANTNITLGSYGGLTDTGLATANDALVASFGG